MIKKMLCMVLVVSAAFCSAQTVDEIIAKSIEARGGMAKLKAVQSQRLSGHISFDQNAEGDLVAEMKRPGKVREELSINSKVFIRTSDGNAGWVINPFAEKSDPEPLSAGEMGNMAQKADFDGAIVDYKAKGNQVELLGKERVEGKDAYKLKVTLKNGEIRYDYLDASTYLGLKWEGKIAVNGNEIAAESYFHDYKPVEGVMYSFAIDSTSGDTHQKIVFDKIEVNPAIDDARFGKPAAQPEKPAN